MSTVNLYDVLKLPNDCKQSDIKKAYRTLVKKYHPDKNGDPELFELITHAYNILGSEKKRGDYDIILNISKQSVFSHESLKESSKNFDTIQKTNLVPKTKKEKKDTIKRMHIEFNQKHGYDDTDVDPIDEHNFHKRLNDLSVLREQEEIEYIPEKLFEGPVNASTFNAMFDKMKKTKGGDINGGVLTKHTGAPDAWGSDGLYSSYESSYDKLYVENDTDDLGIDGDDYGAFNPDEEIIKLSKDDVDDIDGVDYTTDHNKIESGYEKRLEDLMNERNNETQQLYKMEIGEYQQDTGNYGIFDKIGIDTGKSNIIWENEDDVRKRYEKLLEQRKSV